MERITQWGTSNFWYSRIIIRMGKSREMVRTIREMRNTQKKFNWKTRREDTIREAYNITMVSVFAGCKVVQWNHMAYGQGPMINFYTPSPLIYGVLYIFSLTLTQIVLLPCIILFKSKSPWKLLDFLHMSSILQLEVSTYLNVVRTTSSASPRVQQGSQRTMIACNAWYNIFCSWRVRITSNS